MRHEFPAAVKRAAFERSGGQCEAMGERYGLPAGVRCQRAIWLSQKPPMVNYEHYPRGAHDPHPETTTLANCTAICPQCNQYANNKHDTPREQKIKNLRYDHALHEARMARKAGIDVADPVKPRGRQSKKQVLRTRATKWPKRKFPTRQRQP